MCVTACDRKRRQHTTAERQASRCRCAELHSVHKSFKMSPAHSLHWLSVPKQQLDYSQSQKREVATPKCSFHFTYLGGGFVWTRMKKHPRCSAAHLWVRHRSCSRPETRLCAAYPRPAAAHGTSHHRRRSHVHTVLLWRLNYSSWKWAEQREEAALRGWRATR